MKKGELLRALFLGNFSKKKIASISTTDMCMCVRVCACVCIHMYYVLISPRVVNYIAKEIIS